MESLIAVSLWHWLLKIPCLAWARCLLVSLWRQWRGRSAQGAPYPRGLSSQYNGSHLPVPQAQSPAWTQSRGEVCMVEPASVGHGWWHKALLHHLSCWQRFELVPSLLIPRTQPALPHGRSGTAQEHLLSVQQPWAVGWDSSWAVWESSKECHHWGPSCVSVTVYCWLPALPFSVLLVAPFPMVTLCSPGCLHLFPSEKQREQDFKEWLDKTYSHQVWSCDSLSLFCPGSDPEWLPTTPGYAASSPPRQPFLMSFHCFPYRELAATAPVAPQIAWSAQLTQAVQSQMQLLIISGFVFFLMVVLLLQAEGSCFHSCCSLLVYCSQHHPVGKAKEHSSALPTTYLSFFQAFVLFFFPK